MYKEFERYPRRWKLQEGVLERDFQRLCFDLSKYGDLRNFFTANTFIKAEMFECLIENTKYLISNENLWKKLEENKAELTSKYLAFYFILCIYLF